MNNKSSEKLAQNSSQPGSLHLCETGMRNQAYDYKSSRNWAIVKDLQLVEMPKVLKWYNLYDFSETNSIWVLHDLLRLGVHSRCWFWLYKAN